MTSLEIRSDKIAVDQHFKEAESTKPIRSGLCTPTANQDTFYGKLE